LGIKTNSVCSVFKFFIQSRIDLESIKKCILLLVVVVVVVVVVMVMKLRINSYAEYSFVTKSETQCKISRVHFLLY